MANKGRNSGAGGGERQEVARASYFGALELQGIRCFSKGVQRLELSKADGRPARFTILLGNNGTGKTSVLQTLALFEYFLDVSRFFSESLKDGGSGTPALDAGKSVSPVFSETSLFESFPSEGGGGPSQIQVELQEGPLSFHKNNCNIDIYAIDFYRSGSGVGWGRVTGSVPPTPVPFPICYGYGAGRHLRTSQLADGNREHDPTVSLFFESAGLRNAEEWLLRLDYAASKESEIQASQQRTLKQVRELLIEILPDVEAIRLVSPTKSRPNPSVEFKTPYGWVELRHLGYGYRTLIAWMVDFASRMVERYPESPDPLAEPAVVLVDEIDLHLHPTWQRELVGYLTERFPGTQFIVTAHSPLIVQGAEDANIAVLRREGGHVVIDNDVDAIKNWRIDQILTSDLFGLESARPPGLDKPLKRRKELLSKPRLTKRDREELNEIERGMGTLPTGETASQAREMMELVRETQRLLKKHKGSKP